VAHVVTPRIEEANFPSQERCQREVQRILQSAPFRNAPMLQQLLQYLASKAIENSAESMKEYTIGIDVFGRPQDFDPKTDTIVRVQIHRLRQKLKEYYEAEGIRDPVLIEIPKGHYLPVFESVEVPQDVELHQTLAPAQDAILPVGRDAESHGTGTDHEVGHPSGPITHTAVIATVVIIATFAVGLWIGRRWFPMRTLNQSALAGVGSNLEKSPDPVKAFWTAFLGNDPSPVIAYPDAVFLLDDTNDLFRFRRGATDFRGAPVDSHLAEQFAENPALVARAGDLVYENAYLGFGELKAVGMLSNLFGQMGLRPVIKPSRELTVDDLKQHNVIMLGSSSQNYAVAHLSTMGDFSFKSSDSQKEQWRLAIVNGQRRPDEASIYRTERDPNTRVLTTDYSLITIEPGIVPGRYIADLGGLDTTGSEGAVLYATSRQGIEELSRVLPASFKPDPRNVFPTFQALLRIPLEKGYDVLGASLVTVHTLPSTRSDGGAASKSQTPTR
jgi:hypothetical protein